MSSLGSIFSKGIWMEVDLGGQDIWKMENILRLPIEITNFNYAELKLR